MTKTTSTALIVAIAAAVALAAVVLTVGRSGAAQAQSAATPDPLLQAQALRYAAPTDPSAPSPAIVGQQAAQEVAAKLAANIPLPKGGTFADLEWKVAAEGITTAEIQTVLEYNALCDWERAVSRNGGASAEDLALMKTIPQWPSFRESPRGAPLGPILAGLEAGDLSAMSQHMAANCL